MTPGVDRKFAGFALFHRIALLVNDLCFPAKAGLADGADLVDVFHAQMNCAGADGFAETVVGIVLMMGKYSFQCLIRLCGTGWAPMCMRRHWSS